MCFLAYGNGSGIVGWLVFRCVSMIPFRFGLVSLLGPALAECSCESIVWFLHRWLFAQRFCAWETVWSPYPFSSKAIYCKKDQQLICPRPLCSWHRGTSCLSSRHDWLLRLCTRALSQGLWSLAMVRTGRLYFIHQSKVVRSSWLLQTHSLGSSW